MVRSKMLLVFGLAFVVGSVGGASATYMYCSRKNKIEVMENTASHELMAAEEILEQLSLIDKQDYTKAQSKLNYDLAGYVYNAKANLNAPGDAGWIFKMILDKSIEQRKKPIYKEEEERFIKAASEPKLIL